MASDAPADTFDLQLEPDYCCGGGHCGPLPGYRFTCPRCEKYSGCRLGDYLEIGQALTCYFCECRMRATKQLGEFEYRFTFDDSSKTTGLEDGNAKL